MPEWIEHTIWWQVFPLGFVGAEPENVEGAPLVHRLGRIQTWLDYAVELGATGLALGPVFAAATHGYDTIDPFRIDPRLGDEGDLIALIKAAHTRGLRVLLDGVFNHVGRGHPAFLEVVQQGPTAQRASWFKLSWPRVATPGAEPDYACFEGHRQLVTLNHNEPAVADYVVSVMKHWLAHGVDGWRLDAAYAVPRRFWSGVLARVRSAYPDTYIVGEVIHGDYAAIVRDIGMDAVTQYELWKAIWSALNDRNLFELAHALERHNSLLDAFVPLTFVSNHGVTRIASRLTDERHLPHALAILLVCGGTPSVYAGDEQAFRGVKEDRIGGDDAIRPAFPDTPAGLAPYGWPIFRLHQVLIVLRRRHPWLHSARTRTLYLTNEQLVLAVGDGTHHLLLALNIAEDAVQLPAPDVRTIEGGEASLAAPGTPYTRVDLGPHGWALLAI